MTKKVKGNVFDQIKEGVGLKKASDRTLGSKKISAKEQKELDIKSSLDQRQKAIYGDDSDSESDISSTTASTGYDSDDDFGPAKVKISPTKTKEAHQKGNSTIDMMKNPSVASMLNRASSSPTNIESESSDWEEETKQPHKTDHKSDVEQQQEKLKTEKAEAEQRKQRMMEAKANLQKSFGAKSAPEKVKTQPVEVSEQRKENRMAAKENLQQHLKAKSTPQKVQTQPVQAEKPAVKAKIQDQAVEDLQRSRKSVMQQAILDAAQKAHELQQEATVTKLKAEAMKVLAKLGVVTRVVHEAADETVKIAQSIATAVSNPSRNEKALQKLSDETKSAIAKLENHLAELKNFVKSTTLEHEKSLSTAFKTSKAVADVAGHAIKLAQAEIKLLLATIARDRAVVSAKTAVDTAKNKMQMAAIVKQAAQAASKKAQQRELGASKQPDDSALRVAEAEAKRAQEEAKAREAEAQRLLEAQQQAQAAADLEQRTISELRRKNYT